MEKQDKGRLTLILNKMSELYPKDITEDLLEIYMVALDGYDIERVARACMEYIKHEKFFPVPAKIIEYYNALPRDDQLALPEPAPTVEGIKRGRLLMRYSRHCLRTKETPTSQGAVDYVKEHRDDDLSQTPFKQEESDLTPIGRVVADLQGVQANMTAEEMKRLRLTKQYMDECDKNKRKWNTKDEEQYIQDHWNDKGVKGALG